MRPRDEVSAEEYTGGREERARRSRDEKPGRKAARGEGRNMGSGEPYSGRPRSPKLTEPERTDPDRNELNRSSGTGPQKVNKVDLRGPGARNHSGRPGHY